MSFCLICNKNSENYLQIYNETEKTKAKSDIKKFFKILKRYINRKKCKGCTSTTFPVKLDKLIEAGFGPCQDCHNLINEFCDIYYVLEETEMILDWKIRRLGSIMECAGSYSNKGLPEFLKIFGLNNIIEEVIEWRQGITAKCNEKLKFSFPMLMLNRCTLELLESTPEMPASHYDPNPPSPLELETSDNISNISANLENIKDNENGQDNTIAEAIPPQTTLQIKEDKEAFHTIIGNENVLQLEETNLVNVNPAFSTDEGEVNTARRLRSIHSCPKCSKTFSTSQSLQAHLTSHSNDEEMSGNEVADDASEEDYDEYDTAELSCEESSSSDSDDDLGYFKEEPNVTSTPSIVLEEPLQNIEEGVENLISEKFKVEAANILQETHLANSNLPSTKKIDIAAYIPIISRQPGRQLGFQTCPKCSKIFSTSQTLQAHLASHSKQVKKLPTSTTKLRRRKKLFKGRKLNYYDFVEFIKIPCPIEGCSKVLYNSQDLEDHKELHGNFSCNFCSNSFDYAPNLARHELSEHCELNGNCLRKGCDFKGNKNEDHIHHILYYHFGLKITKHSRKFNCRKCKTGFTNKARLQQHLAKCHIINKKHKDTKRIKCDVEGCAKSFTNKLSLRYHKKCMHSIKPVCQICNKTSVSQKAFYNHMRKNHPETLTVSCVVEGCEEKFGSEIAMNNHVNVLHKSENYKISKLCPQCGVTIRGLTAFQFHLKRHENNYSCKECGKVFKNNDQLARHYLSHSGPGSWQYQCEICAKKCLSKGKLEEHLRTHGNEKPFVCDICGAKYAHRHNLRIHVNNKHSYLKKDVARKIIKTNFTSRKGVKRKRVETESDSD